MRKISSHALLHFAVAFLATNAFASLPIPSGASFENGVKFTVAGYTNEMGVARETALSGFPVLVRLADNSPSGFLYSDLQNADAADKDDIDIAFIDMYGAGLPFEIDTWDTNGTSLIWVKLPTMEQGTEFVMCWGGGTSGKTVCNDNPWSDYVGVWHMSEASGTVADSTGHGLDAVPAGTNAESLSIASTGPVGNSRQCVDETYLSIGNSDALDVGDSFSVSGWFNVASPQNKDARFFSRKIRGQSNPGWEVIKKGDSIAARGASGDNIASYTPSQALNQAGWKHIFVIYNGRTATIFEDGIEKKNATGGAAPTDNDNSFSIGSYSGGGSSYLVGIVDECRLLDAVPSADWVRAEYDTISDSTFLTVGAAIPYAASAEPQVGVVASDLHYTNATLIATIGSLGKNDAMTADASWVDATVLVALDDAFMSPLFTLSLPRTNEAPISVPMDIVPLVTNTTYYAKVVANNSFNMVGESGTVSFTTRNPGFATGTAMFIERGFTTLSANATVTALGVGAESATLRLEASTDGFASIAASQEILATLDTAETLAVSNLVPNATYALRVRIRNDWGLDTFVLLPDTVTRAVPFATTGIGWVFSSDGSTIDISFGVSGIYDGATGTATLTYGGVVQEVKAVTGAGTLSWPSIQAVSGGAEATVVLSATLNEETYIQTFSVGIAPGSAAVAISDFADYRATTNAVLVHVGDVVTLPELVGDDTYAVGNNLFGSLDGNVLTALRPGILGVNWYSTGATNTLPVIVLPEVGGSGEIYLFDETCTANSTFMWASARPWKKLSGTSANQWPQAPDDVAFFAFYSQPGGKGMVCDIKNLDVSLGALYAGHFKDLASSFGTRSATGDTGSQISFSRTDGKPAVFQICPNTRDWSRTTEFKVNENSFQKMSFLVDTMLSGGYDETNPNFHKGRFLLNAKTNSIPDGVTVMLVEMDRSKVGSGGYTLSLPNLSGSGTFWNHSSALVGYSRDSTEFTGLIRDSGGNKAQGEEQSRSGPASFTTTTITNASTEVIGWVGSSNSQDPSENFKIGVGALYTGWPHPYHAPDPRASCFPARGATMHGGLMLNRFIGNTGWTNSADNAITRDIKTTAFLDVACGFNYIYGDCQASSPDNIFIADSLRHGGKATLGISDQSLFSSGSNTNMEMVLHGVAAFAVGARKAPLESNAASIVPWITARAGSKVDEDLRFAAFDENDRLSKIVHVKGSIADYGEDDNAYVFNNGIALSGNTTVNSLALCNDAKDKLMGEGRTLCISSGGLILGDVSWMNGSSAIGAEDGGDANGSLVLGDAEHPAYVWARGAASAPNQVWAPVTAPGGFVAAYTGNLVLGGDQTGIADEIAINAGTLQLGTTNTPCQLAKGLTIRIFANAALKLQAATSLAGNVVRFDGSASWFGKVEVPEGVAAKCRMASWRDYPESIEWQSLAAGIYTGDEDVAAASGCIYAPQFLSGKGTLQVLRDDKMGNALYIVR